MSAKIYAKALDFEEKAVYYPQERPGYTAWVSLFPFGNGDLGLAFNEIRRGSNPAFTPIPLAFVEAFAFPYRVCPDLLPASNPNLINEYVCMKSSDGGRSWQQTGRCPVGSRHYWHVGFPDGRMVRAIGVQQFRYELGDGRLANPIEESHDGGNTWVEIARIMEGKWFHIHKFKKLSSGSIVAAGTIYLSFGPGGERDSRGTTIPGQITPDQAAFLVSDDGGHTWDGPHYILPGIDASEPDFVELPDGSLLFINSTVQSGRAVRQIAKKTKTRYVNGPLMEIRRGAPLADDDLGGGFTPETVVIRPDGLIVGTRRGGVYSCSNDLGENWYEIDDAPLCEYQPMIVLLPDGRLLTAWHLGGDTRFGEFDMYIGTHSFSVRDELPKATALTLERELSEDADRYVNVFRAALTAGDEPLSGRKIELRLKNHWLAQPDGRINPIDTWDSPDMRTAVTDAKGVARFALTDKDVIRDIHHGYDVAVSFAPDEGDTCAPCRGPIRRAYTMTPARSSPAPYPIYLQHGLVMITPETARRFPDLAEVVKTFNVPEPDATIETWIKASGSEKRAKEILDFLIENHIVSVDDQGIYHWYRAVHSGRPGEPWIRELRICDLEEHIV